MKGLTLAAGALAAAAIVLGAAPAGADRRADAGRIVFVSNRADGVRELYVVGTDGSGLRRLTFNDLFERQPSWSPDRQWIAFSAADPSGNWDIYRIPAAGGAAQRLTSDPERDDSPQWTADGRILYQHGPFSCPCSVRIVAADGSGDRPVDTGPGDAITPAADPHGDRIAYASDRGHPGLWAIYTTGLDGSDQRQITFPTAGMDSNPRFSPQGDDVVFQRDGGTDSNDLYVVHANGRGLRQLTDTPARSEFWPSWTGDGRIVFSATGGGPSRLYSVSASDGSETAVSTWPRAPLLETFDGGSRDASLWHQIQDTGSTIGESGGRLVATIDGSAVPGGQYDQVDTHWGSQCRLPGDYDMQVDFQLLQWPAGGGFYAGLHSFFADASIQRHDGAFRDEFSIWANPNFYSMGATDTAGTLRLVRSGRWETAYVRDGVAWVPLMSGPAPSGDAVYGFGLSTPASEFAHQTGSVAFDDFRLNSGELSCASQSWWDDRAPDAY